MYDTYGKTISGERLRTGRGVFKDTYVSTDYERVKAISQILYGQYHIWELFRSYIYVSDLKTKVFCKENNQIHFPVDKGLTVPK